METLVQKFEDLKLLLTQRASSALGEALLTAFLSSLSEYETAVVKSLAITRKEIADAREENDLLRSLLNISDPAVLAKIISQGEEIRFLQSQVLALKKELDESTRAGDTLRLENKAMEADLIDVQHKREEEQGHFKEALDQVKEQLKGIGQKAFEKQQELNKAKEDLAKAYAAKAFESFAKAEDEVRAAAAKLQVLTIEVKKAIDERIAPHDEASTAITAAIEKSQAAIDQYLKILDWSAPQYVKVSWARFLTELKKRIGELARRQDIKAVWPNEKALPPFITDEKMLVEIVEALARNAFESLGAGGTVDISAQALPGALTVQILDTGGGVKPQDVDKVFLPFYTTKDGHMGLGLARAGKLTRALGGTIVCEPKGIGTLFTLRIPGQPPSAVAPAARR